MATEKLRAELELITSTAEKDLARFHRSLKSVEKTVTSIGGKGGKSMRPLGEGLSAATANASEFEKSMAAANARVIAFGASAGLIIQFQRALKETVKSTVEVEKALANINIVLNTNTAGLQKFGDQLFKIAGQTGQSFKTIAVGATELARQGLSTEKTLSRLNDAMILSRLTGMGAEEAVSNLTAAVNSFNKAGITSAQVINKMAKVDQAFAVSSDDLAKAISRVGSSAVDAGVSMDELLAITTAVQQRTARGGAVIGNAFKTIFTRIGRTDVQKKLAAIGVATRDMQGQMLPATKVLENLSQKFQGLAQSQQNQVAESVAGVFQVNILRAALGDLASKYGIYNRAIKESSSATDEAYQKNEKLNETLDAMVNKTLANLTKAGAGIGEATLKPAIENILGLVNSAIGAFGEGGKFEEFGKGIGKDLLNGLGAFISGPGLALLTVGIGKLLINFGSFAKTALVGILEINKGAMARKGIEESVTASLMRQPGIIKQIERGELSAATAAKDMLAAMRAQNMQADKLAITTRAIAGNMMGVKGGLVGSGKGRPWLGKASGLVPNFADQNVERASAAAGGYKAGVIKTMNVPGEGSVMYNGAETVKRFPGMTQPAIMPPKESPAGANYKSAFGAAHGFDPYAADGFVPNFATAATIFARGMGKISAGKPQGINTQIEVLRTKGPEGRRYAKELEAELEAAAMARKAGAGEVKGKAKMRHFNAAQTLGLLGLSGPDTDSKSSETGLDQIGKFREGSGLSKAQLKKYRVTFTNMQSRSIESMKRGKGKQVTLQKFSDKVSELLTDPIAELSDMVFDGALGNDNALDLDDLKKKFKGNTQLLPPGAEGSIFEAAVNLGLLTTKTSAKAKKDAFDQSTKGAQKPFDFEEVGPAKPDFKSIFDFHESLVYADAKRTIDNKSMGTLINKAYNRGVAGLPYMELLQGSNVAAAGTASKKTSTRKRRASGHVPNFSPLGDAITRERAAGVPVSAIRVSSSPVLKGPGNPGGLGVHNTIDEPAGLGQGISRSRRMWIDPKTYGAAEGFVPNHAIKIRMPRGYSGSDARSRAAFERKAAKTVEHPVEKSKEAMGADKDAKTSETNKEASVEMLAAANLMNAGTGKLMGLATIGYMAGGPIMKSLGADERQSSLLMESAMKLGMAGVLSSQMPGGTGSANPLKGMGGDFAKGWAGPKGMKGPTGPGGWTPAKRGFGEKLWGGMKSAGSNLIGKKPGASFGSMGWEGAKKGAGKLAGKAVPVAGWGWMGYDVVTGLMDGWKESPEEKRLREAQELRASMQQDDIRPLIEQVGGQVSTFSGGFGRSSGRVRGQQFGDLKKTIFGAGGLKERAKGDDQTTILNEYKEFTSSFSQGAKAVETAGEKFNKAILKVAEGIAIAQDAVAEEERIAKLGVQIAGGEFKETVVGKEEKRVGELTGLAGAWEKAKQYFSTSTTPMSEKVTVDKMGYSKTQVNKLANFIKASMQGGVAGANQRIIEKAEELKASKAKGVTAQSREITKDHLTRLTQEAGTLGGPENLLGISMDEYDTILSAGGGQRGGETPELVKAAMAVVHAHLKKAEDLQVLLADKELDDVPKVESGFKDRLSAHNEESSRKIQKIAFGKAKSLALLDEKSEKAKREYNHALGESTRGMYGEADIKLAESKIAAKEAYERVTKQNEEDLEAARSKSKKDTSLIRAKAKDQFTDKDAQDKIIKQLDKIAAVKDVKVPGFGLNISALDQLNNLLAEQETIKASVDATPDAKLYADTLINAIKIKKDLIVAEKRKTALTDVASEGFNTANGNADTQNKIDKLLIDNKWKYNRLLDLQIKHGEATLAVDRARFGKEDVASGRITGSQYAQQQREMRSKLRDAGGMKGISTYDPDFENEDGSKGKWTHAPGAEQASMRTIFQEEWEYGPRQQAEDFEAGMADVAGTVKDSLKEAIKNIASGADSFKDAMFNVFAALADKLADQGISMGVDSAFHWLSNLGGSKHGGSIPRGYNKGGVVTGGSGVRDDVMTRMQGGEYVIKKSAAQKIGYGTLGAINSYAGGGQARVSLAKEFLYTGDDPKRPTGGNYNVSRNLSTAALFREDDPQTSEMFGRQSTLTSYLEYRRKEQERRDKILDNIKQQKKQRLTKAYMSAAMRIGVAKFGEHLEAGKIGGKAPLPTGGEDQSPTWPTTNDWSGARGGSPAMVMGGEYIMNPRTVSKYGTGFMSQLNQGRLPSFQSGGLVGGGAAMAAGITTNNVSLSVNIDKSGGATAETGGGSKSEAKNDERGDAEEAQSSKEFAEAIRGAVLKEITKQQRPGGLLRDGATWAAGRRT